MVATLENRLDSSNARREIVNHRPEIDLFWLYARAATSCDPEELRDLSCSDCDPIRRRVARNPATPQDVLEWLAVDWHPPVRAALAENPLTSESLLEKLAQDKDPEVRLSVAKELAMKALSTRALLELMAKDADLEVAQKAQEALGAVKETNVFAHPGAVGHKPVPRSA